MEIAIAFICGVVIGAAVALAAGHFRGRATRQAAECQFREAFASLSADALAANNEQFLTLARESLSSHTKLGSAELESKKELIDKSIGQVTDRLEVLRQLTARLEASRKEDYGQLSQRLGEAAKQVGELRQTTEQLRSALAHPQQRGQWGERMADDILQMAGMIEGINYTKQQTSVQTGRRPDFTFSLPNSVRLNMDVKFPLDNYLRHLSAEAEDVREAASRSFVSDVRTQVRAIATKDYIDPADGTADFALMFIPNEQMFSFIQHLDATLLSEAGKRRVILVGPLSLLAVLSIARQAAEAANLSRQTDQALDLIGQFSKQWGRFKEELAKLGGRLEAATKQYQSLNTTRTNTLERPLAKLEALRGNTEDAEEATSQEPS